MSGMLHLRGEAGADAVAAQRRERVEQRRSEPLIRSEARREDPARWRAGRRPAAAPRPIRASSAASGSTMSAPAAPGGRRTASRRRSARRDGRAGGPPRARRRSCRAGGRGASASRPRRSGTSAMADRRVAEALQRLARIGLEVERRGQQASGRCPRGSCARRSRRGPDRPSLRRPSRGRAAGRDRRALEWAPLRMRSLARSHGADVVGQDRAGRGQIGRAGRKHVLDHPGAYRPRGATGIASSKPVVVAHACGAARRRWRG